MAPPDLPEKDEPKPLAEVAHDFHNMLQVVMGNLELLKRHLEPGHAPVSRDVLLRPIEAASKAAKELSELGERLIVLSKKSSS